MTGGVPSEPAEGTQYGELPEFEGDTDFDVSRPQSCKYSTCVYSLLLCKCTLDVLLM